MTSEPMTFQDTFVLRDISQGRKWFIWGSTRRAASRILAEIGRVIEVRNRMSVEIERLKAANSFLTAQLAEEVQGRSTAKFQLSEAEARASALVVELDRAKENVKAQGGNEKAIFRLEQEKAVLEVENEALRRDKNALVKQAANANEMVDGISELITRYNSPGV